MDSEEITSNATNRNSKSPLPDRNEKSAAPSKNEKSPAPSRNEKSPSAPSRNEKSPSRNEKSAGKNKKSAGKNGNKKKGQTRMKGLPDHRKMSESQLESQLEIFLSEKQYELAGHWIKLSSYLANKYPMEDVVRLVLENGKFDVAGKMIRSFELSENRMLVSYFIKEMIRDGQFHVAMRYAKELIVDFGKNKQVDNMWTPETMILAMIRNRCFLAAMRYAKEFELLEQFPPMAILPHMVQEGLYMEVFKYVQMYKLEDKLDVHYLIRQMLDNGEWSSAIRCISSSNDDGVKIKFSTKYVVQCMLRVGDFVAAIMYLREFKLMTNDKDNIDLHQQLIDAMIEFKEFYKAIKYAVKLNLQDIPNYTVHRLIELAIQAKQFHVAKLYMNRYKLQPEFKTQLESIQVEQQQMAQQFREKLKARNANYYKTVANQPRTLNNDESCEIFILYDTTYTVLSEERHIETITLSPCHTPSKKDIALIPMEATNTAPPRPEPKLIPFDISKLAMQFHVKPVESTTSSNASEPNESSKPNEASKPNESSKPQNIKSKFVPPVGTPSSNIAQLQPIKNMQWIQGPNVPDP